MSQEQTSVEEFFERVAKSWGTNDGETMGDQFTVDGSLINPFGERADGRDAVASMYTQYFGTVLAGTTTALHLATVRDLGEDHVFVDAEQSIVGEDGNVVMDLHLATLLEREGDAWRFVDVRPYLVPAPPGG